MIDARKRVLACHVAMVDLSLEYHVFLVPRVHIFSCLIEQCARRKTRCRDDGNHFSDRLHHRKMFSFKVMGDY